MINRCGWVTADERCIRYHDVEWGVPVYEDLKLFEFLILEGAQAGLSWATILRKRSAYYFAYDNFDPEKIARWDKYRVDNLLRDDGIIRNRLKIVSAIKNAKAFLNIQDRYGSFSQYIWDFVGGRPVQNNFHNMGEVPVQTALSQKISKDLMTKGFSFVGPTIVYSYMQATGMVNDHIVSCFRHSELGGV